VHAVNEIVPQGWRLWSVTPYGGTVTVTGGTQCAVVNFKSQMLGGGQNSSAWGWTNNVNVNTTVSPSITTTVNPTFNLNGSSDWSSNNNGYSPYYGNNSYYPYANNGYGYYNTYPSYSLPTNCTNSVYYNGPSYCYPGY